MRARGKPLKVLMICDLRGMLMSIDLIYPLYGGSWPNANPARSSGDAAQAFALSNGNHGQKVN